MAVAKKCDACKSFYDYDPDESHPTGITMVHYDEQSKPVKTTNKYELCPECLDKVRTIINN
jgi:hypothetical protein